MPDHPPLTLSTPIKFLTSDGRGPYSDYRWPLPSEIKPGRWVATRARVLRMCFNGLHYTTVQQGFEWIDHRCFVFEPDPRPQLMSEVQVSLNKSVCRRGRLIRELSTWNRDTQIRFLLDCISYIFSTYPTGSKEIRESIQKVLERLRAGETVTGTPEVELLLDYRSWITSDVSRSGHWHILYGVTDNVISEVLAPSMDYASLTDCRRIVFASLPHQEMFLEYAAKRLLAYLNEGVGADV